MYKDELSFFEQNENKINYHIVNETDHSFFGNNISTKNNKHQNETLVLAFHSSLICLKIALCVLL